jgi:SAM-dependent methyltransferase
MPAPPGPAVCPNLEPHGSEVPNRIPNWQHAAWMLTRLRLGLQRTGRPFADASNTHGSPLTDQVLVDQLVQIGQLTTDVESCLFDSYTGAAVWVRDARRIVSRLRTGATVLDWGCGAGQMSWLLARHGFRVIAIDYSERPSVPELMADVDYRPLQDNVRIGLPNESVDAVVSSGTLEHVDSIHASLGEIRRILKPGGCFFVFRFPNQWSISECVARRAGRWSHAIRMSRAELRFLLRSHSFRVERVSYDSFLPMFLGRSFRGLRPLWNATQRQIFAADWALTRAPLVRALSTSMRCVAVANDEYVELKSRPPGTQSVLK